MAHLSIRLLASSTALLCLALTCTPLSAQQQTVYQWKDAKGVTHYADAPPKQTYKKRDINARSGSAVEVVESKKSAKDVSCDNARSNLVKLRDQGPVGIDDDGDGKVDGNMTADQRSAQIELNQAMLKANCTAPATASDSNS